MNELHNLLIALTLIQVFVYEVRIIIKKQFKPIITKGYVYVFNELNEKQYACGIIKEVSPEPFFSFNKRNAKVFENLVEFENEYCCNIKVGENYIFEPIEKHSIIYRLMDNKPFNCTSCLSFHVGLILSIVFLNPIYLTLYLFNEFYERYVN
jgi:hypothetical protein